MRAGLLLGLGLMAAGSVAAQPRDGCSPETILYEIMTMGPIVEYCLDEIKARAVDQSACSVVEWHSWDRWQICANTYFAVTGEVLPDDPMAADNAAALMGFWIGALKWRAEQKRRILSAGLQAYAEDEAQ